jgi:hypothetical protein
MVADDSGGGCYICTYTPPPTTTSTTSTSSNAEDDSGGSEDDPIWSTADYLTNEALGTSLSNLSTWFQFGATFFSSLGALSEIGLTTIGTFGGGAALSWLDNLLPIADVTGGLAGLAVGWEAGHLFHLGVTNPLETMLSNMSAQAAYLSDIFLGNTRIDVYQNNATLVIGQPTVTTGALAFVGSLTTVGIGDAIVDYVGLKYAKGELGRGVYDMFDIAGTRIPLSFVYPDLVSLQLGDE